MPSSPVIADGGTSLVTPASLPVATWLVSLTNAGQLGTTDPAGFDAAGAAAAAQAYAVQRANHTGVQSISTVTGLQAALDAKLAIANNLSDLNNAVTARGNLGLGTVATLAYDQDGTLAANSDLRIATQKATKTYADTQDALRLALAGGTMLGTLNMGGQALTNLATPSANSDAATKQYVDTVVTGVLKLQGSTDCSTNPNYPAASKGDSYVVTVAGKIGGASGTPVDVGDVYFATANNAGGTQAAVGSSWDIVEHNLQGALLAANNLSDLTNATTARGNLGLGNVENTALSTWAGTTSITTLGAITSGTWNATTIAINHGGTGQTTQTAAFDALSPNTTRGDLTVRGVSNNVRLAVGASARILQSDGTDPSWVALSGDVTVAAGGSMTIASGAVTYSKMQSVSATSRILGRKTAGSGTVEECTLSDVLDFIGSAAQGDILYRGASTWARLPAGTNGSFLQTQGAGANPQWATPSAAALTGRQLYQLFC